DCAPCRRGRRRPPRHPAGRRDPRDRGRPPAREGGAPEARRPLRLRGRAPCRARARRRRGRGRVRDPGAAHRHPPQLEDRPRGAVALVRADPAGRAGGGPVSAPTVLVTGASGMLGGAVATALRDRGATVRAFQRRPAGIDGVEDVCGSLTEADDVRRAVQGADAVVHLAAKVSISGPESEYRAINIGGTENVLDALRANGGGTLVNVSTPSAAHLGRAIVGLDATPADPERARGPYARTKAAAELLAMDADGHDGISVTSIRPHIVWGPGDTQ